MRYLHFAAVLALLLVMLTAVFVLTARQDIKTDVIYTNDIVQTVRENIDDLSVLSDKFRNEDIIIFDTEGKCIYPQSMSLKLSDMRKDHMCLAVTEDSVFYATVCIPDPAASEYERAYKRLRMGALVLLGLILILLVLFCVYVRKEIIRPFCDLRDFAGRIAIGDLDIPLSMDRNNAFGKFTESFDIMREELKAARDRENELKRKEKELIAALSHDIKTPLAGIKIICDILTVKANDDYVLDKVGIISRKTNEIDMLVSDLLTSTLDDMGELTVQCTDESSMVLYEMVKAADPKEYVRQDDIPECLISIDKKRMLQIISNIIGNSYKYADTPIDISYLISGDYLKMIIADHGKGVSADELPMITNKFYRGSGVGDINGSGLGLYIASELMGMMKGEIICSSHGEGLTVTLMILLS